MKLKRFFALLTAALITVSSFAAVAAPNDDDEDSSSANIVMDSTIEKGPDIQYAEAAILMDMESGRLLYSKNASERLYPASTTKMMTGIIALEEGNMSDMVTATYAALKDITNEDSHMGILIGEELTMEQLINGMLVYSANDAANVIAIHLAGSMEAFVDKMNTKAAQLGMSGTHFQNPCGVHDDDHYTTAEDLAILAKYCMQNEQFREIAKKPTYHMDPTNKYGLERNLPTTNLFLSRARSSYHYYQPCIGIKTGHTSKAGYCLVAAAEHEDTELLTVVMKCDNKNDNEGAYSYLDTKKLFEFGFNNYTHKVIAEPGDIVGDAKVMEAMHGLRVSATVPEQITALIPSKANKDADIKKEVDIPESIDAPVKQGDKVGSVVYSYDGKSLARVDLVAANTVERNEIIHIMNIVLKVVTSPFFFIPAIVLILLLIIASRQKKKRERKRRIQQMKRSRQRAGGDVVDYPTPDRKASRTQIQREETKGSNSRYKEGR